MARLISFTGDQLARVALLISVHDTQGTGPAIGLLLLATTVPRFLGPLLGPLSDRLDQRRLMIACELGQAAVFAAIALASPPFPVLLALVAVATVLATAFMPAGRSALPVMVDGKRLQSANALLATGLNAGLALGPALGGLLATTIGIGPVLLLDSASFMVSAILVSTLALPRRAPSPGESPETFWATLREGLGFARRHRVVGAVALGLLVSVTFASLDNVALVFLTRDVLSASSFAFGLVTSAFGVGMVLSPLLLARTGERVASQHVLYTGLALTAGGSVLTGLSPVVAVAVLAQGIAGGGNGLENVANDTLIQRAVPQHRLGTVFGAVYTMPFVAEAIAYSTGGPLVDWVGGRATMIISGVGVLGALILVRLMLSGAIRRSSSTR